MKFVPTPIPGAYVIELERIEDDRGFFARSWCADEFVARGLSGQVSQCSVSGNSRRGTLRGLHYQAQPHAETKLVRCTRGVIYDVVVDLRRDSPTFSKWTGIELSGRNGLALYIPASCAHGFVTLADESDVLYMISDPYVPQAARGVRWDDEDIGIKWPLEPLVLSPRDAALPRLRDMNLAADTSLGNKA